MTNFVGASILLDNITCFCCSLLYMCVLAPEAVTELDYEQSYGSDHLINITIKWIVSSKSDN